VTPIVSSRSRRGAVALGGMFIAASAVLVSTPAASAAPSSDAVNAINDRYSAFGGAGSLLGAPTGEAVDAPGGAERDYEGGAIYYSKDTGAHVMYGAILERYKALGGPGSELGYPKNDESDTGDGTGRFNDFTTPGGASMYWTPQWGASVIKGRVLDAWRQSGDITGPFGYPSADTSILDGVQTGKFVGPGGTEIQWSEAAGLVTIPAALAATIPGFSATAPTAEGTTSVTKPSLAPTTTTAPAKGSGKSSKWWWIPVGLAALALLIGLLRLMTRKPKAPEPVRVAAQHAPDVTAQRTPDVTAQRAAEAAAQRAAEVTAPRATEVKKPAPVIPPPPVRPVTPVPTLRPPAPPAPPAPAKVVPLVKTPPPAPKPVTPAAPVPPVPKPDPAPETVAIRPLLSEPPKATIHTESAAHDDTATVIKYESSAPAATSIQVTYENNAVGDNQESRADKSDTVPDSRQL